MRRIPTIGVRLMFLAGLTLLWLAPVSRAAAQDVAQLQDELAKQRAISAALQAQVQKLEAELAATRDMLTKLKVQAADAQQTQAQREAAAAAALQAAQAERQRADAQALAARRELEALQQEPAKFRGAGAVKPAGRVPPSKPADLPPQLDGAVTTVAGNGTIEISLGARNGLKKGHQLEVHRLVGDQGIYIGRIEVVSTSAAAAVCKSLAEFERRRIEKGDRVTTKL